MEPKEFKTRLAQDEEFAGTVADSIAENEKMRERLMDNPGFLKSMADQLLTDEVGLVERAKGELEMQDFGVSQPAKDYDVTDAKRDFSVCAKAAYAGVDPKIVAEEQKSDTAAFQKSTDETNFTSAGLTIPTPLADELIPILDAEPIFLQAGPNIMGMPQGKLDIGRQNADPTAQWQGEATSISTSDAGFDMLQLTAHKLTAGHEFSNDFLRRDRALIDEGFMFDRLMKVAQNKLDTTIFEGGGGGNEPEGLKVQTDSGKVFSSNGNSITNLTQDMRLAKNNLDSANVPDNDRAWFMRPEVANDIMFDINGGEDTFPFRNEMVQNGTIFGDPFYTTNNISSSGSPGDSDIYYVEMSEMLVGRSTDFEMATSPHEKFTQDLTILRLVSHWDFQMMHTAACSIIEDYTQQA